MRFIEERLAGPPLAAEGFRLLWRTSLCLLALRVFIGCSSTKSSQPVKSVAPSPSSESRSSKPEEATDEGTDSQRNLPECYPYEKRAGACLTRCDFDSAEEDKGCANAGWPLICNSDGSCTPEMRHE